MGPIGAAMVNGRPIHAPGRELFRSMADHSGPAGGNPAEFRTWRRASGGMNGALNVHVRRRYGVLGMGKRVRPHDSQ
jgi:hypothetical protein